MDYGLAHHNSKTSAPAIVPGSKVGRIIDVKWIGRITEVIETNKGKKAYKIEYADQDAEIMAEQDVANFIIRDTDDHIGASVVKTFPYKIQYDIGARYYCISPSGYKDDNRWWPKHLVDKNLIIMEYDV